MLVAPEHMHLYEIPIDRLPFFDEDLERQGDPPAVAEFKSNEPMKAPLSALCPKIRPQNRTRMAGERKDEELERTPLRRAGRSAGSAE